MFKLGVKIIFVSALLQALIVFFLGPDFGFEWTDIHWDLLDVVLVIVSYLCLIAFPLENRHNRFGREIRVLLPLAKAIVFLLPFLLWGIYLGMMNGYRAFYSYTIGIVWILVVGLLAYLARLSLREIEKLIKLLLYTSFVMALFAIPALLASNFWGLPNPFTLDYYGNSGLYLISSAFLYLLVQWIVFGRLSPFDHICSMLFFVALVLAFTKKIILPTVVTVPFLIFLAWRSDLVLARSARSVYAKLSIMLVIGLIFVWLFSQVNALPSEVTDFYLMAWQVRYLHLDSEAGVLGGRSDLWSKAFAMILDNPLGYGIGVPIETDSTLKPLLSVHNTYLHFFLALGVPGGLVVLWIVFQLVRVLFKTIQVANRSHYSLHLFLVANVIWFLVMCLGDMFTIMPVAYVLFALSTGFLLRSHEDNYLLPSTSNQSIGIQFDQRQITLELPTSTPK